MKRFNSIPALFIILIFFLVISCNQSDEQRKFEREAISLPENFTQTDNNGEVVEGHIDSDDWRIAPFYQGLVYIDTPPPFPNPLLSNQRLKIEVQVTGFDVLSGLNVFVLYNENSAKPLYNYLSPPVRPGTTSISLDALDIARIRSNPVGLYRIILEDDDRNIISYGDIKIE